jgi:hypothetical protein
MLKIIGDKGDNVGLGALSLFNSLTDEDFLAIHKAGQLKNLCLAISLDIQSFNNKKVKTYDV